jgi:hypothetical protein
LKDLDAEVDINCIWETVGEHINISDKETLDYYEQKKHKPNCSGYRIQVK